jgi:hypothetical protein
MTEAHDQSHAVWLAAYEGKPTKPPALESPQSKSNAGQQISHLKQAPKIIAPGDLAALIPEGWYSARCYEYRFMEFWSSSKLVLKFGISEGRYLGTRLECFYNLDRQKNKSGDYDYVPSKRGSYLRLMKVAFADIEQSNGDWLSPENLIGKMFRVEVTTVNRDHARETLGKNQYSKIKPNIELIHE